MFASYDREQKRQQSKFIADDEFCQGIHLADGIYIRFKLNSDLIPEIDKWEVKVLQFFIRAVIPPPQQITFNGQIDLIDSQISERIIAEANRSESSIGGWSDSFYQLHMFCQRRNGDPFDPRGEFSAFMEIWRRCAFRRIENYYFSGKSAPLVIKPGYPRPAYQTPTNLPSGPTNSNMPITLRSDVKVVFNSHQRNYSSPIGSPLFTYEELDLINNCQKSTTSNKNTTNKRPGTQSLFSFPIIPGLVKINPNVAVAEILAELKTPQLEPYVNQRGKTAYQPKTNSSQLESVTLGDSSGYSPPKANPKKSKTNRPTTTTNKPTTNVKPANTNNSTSTPTFICLRDSMLASLNLIDGCASDLSKLELELIAGIKAGMSKSQVQDQVRLFCRSNSGKGYYDQNNKMVALVDQWYQYTATNLQIGITYYDEEESTRIKLVKTPTPDMEYPIDHPELTPKVTKTKKFHDRDFIMVSQ